MKRIPVKLSGALQSTRIPAGKQCAINMYPHSDGGYRQMPGLVEFGLLAVPSNAQSTNDPDTEMNSAKCMRWGDSGTKLYLLDGLETIYQYSASTAYDITTLTYASKSYDTSAQDVLMLGFDFSPDGDYLVTCGRTNHYLYEYTLSTAWDISTASYVGSADISGSIQDPTDVQISSDGKRFYVVSSSDDKLHQEARVTAYSLASAQDATNTKTLAATKLFSGFRISPDGSTIVSRNASNIYQTYLSTPWDIASIASDDVDDWPAGSLTFSPAIYNGTSIDWPNGKLYVCGESSSGTVVTTWSWDTGSPYCVIEGGAFRGLNVMSGTPFIVMGTTLFAINSEGHWYPVGTVTGTGFCVMDNDGTNLVIVNGSVNYLYSLSSGFSEITDSTIDGTTSTAYLDSTFFYTIDGKVFASNALDPTTIDATDVITAESFTDDIVRNFVLNQLHYSFGTYSIEIHYNTGQGNTGLSRQAVIERGIIGRLAVDSIDNTIYFVDHERRLSILSGLQYQPLSVPGLQAQWESYTTVSDCIVSTFAYQQENFIEVTFPTEDESWVIHEKSGEVFCRTDWNASRSRMAGYASAYGKTLGIDHTNSKVYEFSPSVYQDDGNALTRTLYSQKISSEMLGLATREFELCALIVKLNSSAVGSVTIGLSEDDGETFTTRTESLAAQQESIRLPLWGDMMEGIVSISTTSNALVDALSLAVEVEPIND